MIDFEKVIRDAAVKNKLVVHKDDAEGSAAKIFDAALDAGREVTAKTMNEGANKAVAVIHEELVAAILHQRVELDAIAAEMKRPPCVSHLCERWSP